MAEQDEKILFSLNGNFQNVDELIAIKDGVRIIFKGISSDKTQYIDIKLRDLLEILLKGIGNTTVDFSADFVNLVAEMASEKVDAVENKTALIIVKLKAALNAFKETKLD
ncbi:MAG: hypothetical protein PHS49_00275 [Candidatus Gracilibacteria bacterium]|nr:hypothetical protein [Candidatus Gracilibacteria bacterium]